MEEVPTRPGASSLVIAAALAFFGAGCASLVGDFGESDGSGTTSSASGGVGGAGAASTTTTTGADDGGAVAGRSESVSGGRVAENAQYRMVFTLGQPSLSQQKASAGDLRLQAGLLGATETTP